MTTVMAVIALTAARGATIVSARTGGVPTDVTPEYRIATATLAVMVIVVILAGVTAAGVIAADVIAVVERKQE